MRAKVALRRTLPRWVSMVAALVGSMAALAGQSTDREFEVATYDRIHLVGKAELRLIQDRADRAAGTPQIHVSGAPDCVAGLVIESSDGVLYLDASQSPRREGLLIQATVAQLKEVLSEGSSRVSADGLAVARLALEGVGSSRFDLQGVQVDDLTVVGKGGSHFSVSGAVENQVVDMYGSGAYLANELASQTSQVNVWGGGQIELWVEQLLDVTVFGNAQVKYSGSPWVLQNLNGTGAIRPAAD